MKEEKFKVINFIRELIVYVDKYLTNFPKKEIEIKNRIRNESFDLCHMFLFGSAIRSYAGMCIAT